MTLFSSATTQASADGGEQHVAFRSRPGEALRICRLRHWYYFNSLGAFRDWFEEFRPDRCRQMAFSFGKIQFHFLPL